MAEKQQGGPNKIVPRDKKIYINSMEIPPKKPKTTASADSGNQEKKK
ncbi:MAG: hypothetical protein R6W78_10160 [Bacteroidales bacterium]